VYAGRRNPRVQYGTASFGVTRSLAEPACTVRPHVGARGRAHDMRHHRRDAILLSVVTIGEIRRGIENVRRRDTLAARALERWLRRVLIDHSDRILAVDLLVAEQWGRLNVPDPLPVIDGLLAATAKVHGLTLATRNVKDVARSAANIVNPFEP
jgi:predicted nucleic acid-binding protein